MQVSAKLWKIAKVLKYELQRTTYNWEWVICMLLRTLLLRCKTWWRFDLVKVMKYLSFLLIPYIFNQLWLCLFSLTCFCLCVSERLQRIGRRKMSTTLDLLKVMKAFSFISYSQVFTCFCFLSVSQFFHQFGWCLSVFSTLKAHFQSKMEGWSLEWTRGKQQKGED